MKVDEIKIGDVDLSEHNVRKNLTDGEDDSSIIDLANSIAKQGLLSPITVVRKPDGRYGLIAGQRRFLACQRLAWATISAIVRDRISDTDGTVISLIENVHRADMNPLDKAHAFQKLLERFKNLADVSKETGVGSATIKKYIDLISLAPELQSRLVAGETRGTEALAQLARQIEDPEKQTRVWDKISGFTQDVQKEILKRTDPSLENLDDLVDEASEGAFDVITIKNCPWDCPKIPSHLKAKVAKLIERETEEESDDAEDNADEESLKQTVRKKLGKPRKR